MKEPDLEKRDQLQSEDTGHNALLADLQDLLNQAEDFQFHDFENSDYALPKNALIVALQSLMQNVKSGKYDN